VLATKLAPPPGKRQFGHSLTEDGPTVAMPFSPVAHRSASGESPETPSIRSTARTAWSSVQSISSDDSSPSAAPSDPPPSVAAAHEPGGLGGERATSVVWARPSPHPAKENLANENGAQRPLTPFETSVQAHSETSPLGCSRASPGFQVQAAGAPEASTRPIGQHQEEQVCRPIRVFIVDDHDMVRRGVNEVLTDAGDITIVGESATVADALRRIPVVLPDVVLLDVRLPDGSGIDVCRQIRARHPSIRTLMITAYGDHETELTAAQAGAEGLVLKQIRGPSLIDAVRRVAAGVSPPSRARLPDESGQIRRSRTSDRLLATLSRQERRVLDGLIDGLTNRQIGNNLNVAEQTIKNHVTSLLNKLGAKHRAEAAVVGDRLRREADPTGTPTGPSPQIRP
jgi:two-component system response regulator DevR